MSDPIDRALDRLRAGFLGEPHRDALAGLLAAVDDAITLGGKLSPAIGAAYRLTVEVLGTDPALGAPATGGAE
jgi:hypothetical protein